MRSYDAAAVACFQYTGKLQMWYWHDGAKEAALSKPRYVYPLPTMPAAAGSFTPDISGSKIRRACSQKDDRAKPAQFHGNVCIGSHLDAQITLSLTDSAGVAMV